MQNNKSNKKVKQSNMIMEVSQDLKVQTHEATNKQDNNQYIVNSDNSELIRQYMKQSHIQMVRKTPKIQRNELCPCGSGLKYKQCCLKTGKFEGLIPKNK